MSNRAAHPAVRRFLGFVLAGGAATSLNFGIFLVLYSLGLHYLVASMIGYLSGIAVSYVINVLAVFKDRESSGAALVRYVLAYLVALGLQMALLEIFVRLGTSPTISNAIAIVVVMVLNFFAIRRWVFQKAR